LAGCAGVRAGWVGRTDNAQRRKRAQAKQQQEQQQQQQQQQLGGVAWIRFGAVEKQA
jgi:hypothetical protein